VDRWQEPLVTKDRLYEAYARFTGTEPPLADPHERWCERTGVRRPSYSIPFLSGLMRGSKLLFTYGGRDW